MPTVLKWFIDKKASPPHTHQVILVIKASSGIIKVSLQPVMKFRNSSLDIQGQDKFNTSLRLL